MITDYGEQSVGTFTCTLFLSFWLKSFRLKDSVDCLHETLSNLIWHLHVPALSIGMTLWHAHIRLCPVCRLLHLSTWNSIFSYALFLFKVLLLIKQQHEFEGILLLEVMRKRWAHEADLFGGFASLRSISLLPLPPANRSVWMKVRSKDWWERVVLLELSDL